jgi:hypothetical protein
LQGKKPELSPVLAQWKRVFSLFDGSLKGTGVAECARDTIIQKLLQCFHAFSEWVIRFYHDFEELRKARKFA